MKKDNNFSNTNNHQKQITKNMKFTKTLIVTLAAAQPLDVQPKRRSSQEVADVDSLSFSSQLFLDQVENYFESDQTIDQADFSALDSLPDAYLGDLALRMQQLGDELELEDQRERDLNDIDTDDETDGYLDVLDGMDEDDLQLMMNKLNESIEQFVGMPLDELDQLPDSEFEAYVSQI